MPKKPTTFSDFFRGIGKSRFFKGGFDSLIGIDIHTELGSARSSLAMVKESGTTVTELCKAAVVSPSNGDSFWFSSSSGKIWKRTSAGVWSLVHTNTQGACLGALYFNGFIYYASASKLGRQAIGVASSEATWTSQNDSWATFTNADASYHPMAEQNLALYIGDGKFVASVDSAAAFSANALDLTVEHRITALAPFEDDLLIGTLVHTNANRSGVYRWDTYSASWTVVDYVDEIGVNMFIPADNLMYAQIGTVGNIYVYTGSAMELFKTLRDHNNTITTDVLAYGATNLNGLPLIAQARGVFSLGRRDRDMPIALNIEYAPAGGQGTTPGAIAAIGSQVLYANGTQVDKLDTNRANGQIITPIALGTFERIRVIYDSLPSGTSITIDTKADGASSWTSQTVVTDSTNENVVYTSSVINNKNSLQARITLNSSTSNSPIIYLIEFI